MTIMKKKKKNNEIKNLLVGNIDQWSMKFIFMVIEHGIWLLLLLFLRKWLEDKQKNTPAQRYISKPYVIR